MEVVIKSGNGIKVDHPERHPDYRRLVKKAEKLKHKLKFESEGERRDYERAVRANPHNIPGFPAFYPPESIRSFIEMPKLTEEDIMKSRTEMWLENQKHEIYLACDNCIPLSSLYKSMAREGITPHMISHSGCFCKLCGKQKPYKI